MSLSIATHQQPTGALRVVILGGGFAGLSTAYQLSLRSSHRITLLEREPELGVHASGRNAGLVMQCLGSSLWSDLVTGSRRHFESISDESSFRATGSWQLGSRERLEALIQPGVTSHLRSAHSCRERNPILAGSEFEAALETPSDGVIDPHRLLAHYSGACTSQGVDVRLGVALSTITSTPNESSRFRITIENAVLEADILVNAAGAWANEVARGVGVARQPLTPFKRHLFHYAAAESISAESPFIWDQGRDFYVRPMAGNEWLYCLCDETAAPSPQPTVDAQIRGSSQRRRMQELPALANAQETQSWACFRTKSRDGNPIIGWDPQMEGFFWVAGLGGGGMSASWKIGEWATDRLLSQSPPDPREDPVTPLRFSSDGEPLGDSAS